MPEVCLADLQQAERRTDPEFCDPCGLLREMLRLSPNPRPTVVCVTSADEDDPKELGRQHRAVLSSLGAGQVDTLDFSDRRDVERDPSAVERLRRAEIVLLCGGDQSLLAERFGATSACRTIRERYWNDASFVLAGNSAGAMILAGEMITGDGTHPSRAPSMGTGWSFLSATVDTHVGPRRRRRLGKAVRESSGGFGLGVTTQAALILAPRTSRICGGPVIFVTRNPASATPASTSHVPSVAGCEDYARDGLTAHIYEPGDSLSSEHRNRLFSGQTLLADRRSPPANGTADVRR